MHSSQLDHTAILHRVAPIGILLLFILATFWQYSPAQAQGPYFSAQMNKSFSPISIPAGGISTLSVSIYNPNPFSLTLSAVPPAWIDTLPAGMSFASSLNVTNSCGGSVSAVGSTLSLSGGTVPAQSGTTPGSCTVTVDVTSTTAGNLVNTIPAGTLKATDPSQTIEVSNSTPASATLEVNAVLPPSLSKTFAPNTVWIGQPSTLTIQITNNDGNYQLTGVAFADSLPTGLQVASPAGASNSGCGSTAVFSPNPGDTALNFSGGIIAVAGSCTLKVQVTSSTPGIYTDTIPANAIQTHQDVTNGAAALATLNVQSIGVTKAFSPVAFQQGGSSQVTITLSNPTPSAYTGVSFTDSLPSGLSVVSPAPTTTCGGSLANTSSSVSLSGGTVPDGSVSTPGTCQVHLKIASSIPGTYTDSIPVGGVTTSQGASNVLAGTANLTVYATGLGLSGSKGFTPSSIPVGGISRLTITITAPADTHLTNLSLTDALPSGVQVAGTPSPATTNCGSSPPPTFTPQPGDTSLTFTGGVVAQGGTCTLGVDVTSSTPGTVTDTISPVNISDTEVRDLAGNLTANLNVSGLSVSKAFYPPVVGPNGVSTLTVSLTNTNTSQLDSVSFSDTLPSGVAVASTPNVRTTCPNATITANSGSQLIGMSGGILPADVSGVPGLCTVSVDVIGQGVPGAYWNYIPSGNVSGTIHGTSLLVSNPDGAGAYLTIESVQINVVKGFSPQTVFAASASTLTVLLSNPNNAVLTGIQFTDPMLGTGGGMIVANPPSPSVGTCGGTLSATPGATLFSFSGGSLAAYASCTLTLNITMTVSANLTNTIAAGAVKSENGAINSEATSASLTNLPGASVTKLFLQNPISAGSGNTSNLQITIQNTGSTELDGMGMTDDFPSGMTVATDVSTSQCGGTVTGPTGAGSITLAGGSLASGSSCTIQVEVTAPVAGSYQDCIAAGALQDTEGATNQKACDTLVVNPVLAPPSIGKDFSPNPIAAGGTSVLTFTITNPNPDTALTGVGFSDDFPAGLTVASVPDMAQCGGSVTSTPDSASVTLAGGTIGAGQSCTVVVSVTAPSGGAYTNTSGQVSSTNGGPGNTATDTLDVLGPPQIGKAFNPNSISAGGTSLLTFTIMNPSANPLALSGVGFTDELPAGVTVASPPASPQCAGTVTNTSDSITLSGGTIAVNSSCTVQVTVTAAFGGTYVNTSGAVASANGGTGNTATDTLYVAGAGLTLQKTISTPTYQHADDTLSYTYTLTNTGDRTLYGPFEVQDNLIGVFGCGAATYLDVNTQTSCTASYTVKPGDVAAGSVQNTATATGWGTQSQTSPVTSNPSSATAYLEALTLTKHTSTVGYQTAGNTISYSYTLTNTGPVTLYWPFYVSDDHINNEAQFTCSSATILAPYANISCDAPSLYTVLPGDVTKGSVTNTATATAQDAPAGGRTVTSPPSSVTVYKIVAPSIRKAFSPNPIAVGQSSILTFTITGPSTNKVALTGVGFTDAFPAGLMVTTAPSSLQCGGSVTSTSTSITLHSGTVVPGGTCTVTVSVTAGSGGSYQNTSGPVTSSNGGTGNTASDTLTVVAPPTIGKSFAPGAIVLGGKSTLTFALTAPAGNTVPLAGVTFTDDLPTNLVVSTPPSGITADCGTPTFSPAAGATTLSFTSGTIQAGGTCTVTVSVTALAAGTYNNATGAVRSSNGGTGAPSNIATLTVNPSADLSITKNDGLTGVNRGATVTYVIVVRNAGPSTVVGASVTDTVPSSLLGATWTCVADPGASCTSSGSGNINDTVTIPVGKKVIYRLTATVSSTAATLIVNTASVLPPSGVTDSNLSNNSATDTDYLNRSPNACEISGIVFYDANTNGVFDSGDAVLSGVTITLLDQYGHVLTATATGSGGNYSFDNLLPGTYTVVQTNPAGYPINTTLDHVSVVLAPGTSAVVDFGDQKSTGAAISDPAVTKYASPTVARIGDTVTYTITVGNNGATDASNVNLSDTLPSFLDVVSITILPNPSLPVTIAGNTFTIQFGTVTPTDYYTVIVVTKVNGSAHPPGGVNTASITTTSPGDLLFNDSASAYLTIVAHRVLPATGFAPGRVTVLPAQADAGQKANSGMTIEIPTLGLNTAVVGVPESGDSWDITWLGNDVGYLEGTAFPTWSGNSVLTGHVYGANGLPGPFVNLKSLKWGDQLIILFGAQRYIYEVQTNKVVAPDDTSAFGHKDLPWLTLVTCKDYNPLTNTYAHRVAVGAVLVKIESDPATASPGAALPGP